MSKGFTLIETILASVISMILITSFFGITRQLERSVVSKATSLYLFQRLHEARAEARATRSSRIFSAESRSLLMKSNGTTLRSSPLPLPITIGNRNRIGFTKFGKTQFSSTVTIPNSKSAHKVSLSPDYGKISVKYDQ